MCAKCLNLYRHVIKIIMLINENSNMVVTVEDFADFYHEYIEESAIQSKTTSVRSFNMTRLKDEVLKKKRRSDKYSTFMKKYTCQGIMEFDDLVRMLDDLDMVENAGRIADSFMRYKTQDYCC